MQKAKARRELLIIRWLLNQSYEVINRPGFQLLRTSGPFLLMHPFDEMHKTMVPNQNEREKEIAKAMMVVNPLLPVGFHLFAPEHRLWYACNLVMRLVASGWQCPHDQLIAELIQRMYGLATNISMKVPPCQDLQLNVAEMPEKLRAKGLFLQS